MRIRIALLIVGLMLLTTSAVSQPIEWTERAVSGPSPRYAHAMAYDAARDVTVLFGGQASVYNGETWEWNGVDWTQRAVSGPSARSSHAMAYDAARGVTVLFGGYGPGAGDNGETWEWNGSTWTQRVVSGPSPRRHHAMVYDAARGVTVLFGGYRFPAASEENGETWEWDGTVWTQRMVTGPSPRFLSAMAYDSIRGVTVLFGGKSHEPNTLFGDTWEWDGTTWTQRAVTGPSARGYHAMDFAAARGVSVLFGGLTGGNSINAETWEWNGDAWSQRSVSGPSGRVYHAMVYDVARGFALLFGGWTHVDGTGHYGDTWVLGLPCGQPVSISSHPASVALVPGGPASFTVAINGSAISYRWRHNSVDLADGPRVSGATTPTLTISSVQASDEGEYDCQVAGLCSTATSNPAVLSCDPILLTHPPAQQLLVPGLALAVTVPANAPYSYRWRQNGQNLFNIPGIFSGVTTRTLTILSNDPSLEGVYDVVVANACGSATSTPADVRRCFADVNCDFALDGFDVEVQELAVGGLMTDYCQPDPDFNGDFALDGFDVEAVEVVVGGGPCP